MTWFGWLTKGYYEITLLDRLIGVLEMSVSVIIIMFIYYLIASVVIGKIKK